ncbi:HEPN-associated N-terminal domain-containing protein [Ralstonia pseudosolanacearum]|uniref:HEPN-associated N-terminal domain-containing protein n=1 Tax=Ralstonia pseudosolanacearum TaxID=1310165 RepID=UPI0009C102BA|nr:HEPN-associated N-terminal domain-containing protein [Ralstonia pseudosolanacearum]MDC6296221.1 HEPN-associated N-terminal domain-containing protein [Ralstonia pseudosolanacearum]MDD7791806.1 HEPN-associated N-terminal domain-containing protein [Ralstonia pseudosolanacearum]MDN3368843.1 HEPN-associated N-terminal domain-containing protein [Ralstonia pseudosolanacearum]QOK87890.1 RES family NAD+ phosphorylase [Ralstonia pseudosolanacearum]
MGRAKAEWLESTERGWSECDKLVCADCVEDAYLKDVIANNVFGNTCEYCGRTAPDLIAAPVLCIQEEIASAVDFFYCEPSAAGVPYESREGGWLIEPTSTTDVLLSLNLECHDDLFDDIEGLFLTTDWVPSAKGHWASSHAHELLRAAWEAFTEIVKHRTRYFFSLPTAEDDSESKQPEPAELLARIGDYVKNFALFKHLEASTSLYRARVWADPDVLPDAASIGAPPSEKAAAGRMNPAGIAYLYLAREPQTAFAETLSRPPCIGAVGMFKTCRSLRVLDLVALPTKPSIFDSGHRTEWTELTFLKGFVDAITIPIAKDGREHVNYVPSQIVSEYFAKVFRDADGEQLDGIVYPSTVRPSGQNVVLFPNSWGEFDDKVSFESGWTSTIDDWPALQAELS